MELLSRREAPALLERAPAFHLPDLQPGLGSDDTKSICNRGGIRSSLIQKIISV